MNDPRPCYVAGCTRVARCSERSKIHLVCRECKSMLCAEHTNDHPCEEISDADFDAKNNKRHIDWVKSIAESIPAIKAAAEELRPGHTVSITVPRFNDASSPTVVDEDGVDLQGDCNVHFPMEWDDGVRWLARIKIAWTRWSAKPLLGLDKYVQNEYAITHAARRILGDLVPRAWLPRAPIKGLDMLFLERMEGYIAPRKEGGWWGKLTDEGFVPSQYVDLVMEEFPQIIEKIAEVPFDRMGTFWPNPFDKRVDAAPGLGPLIGGRDGTSGPYPTFAAYMNDAIQHQLAELHDGSVHVEHHRPEVYYLSLLELRALVNGDADMSNPEPMYLFHNDYWQFMFNAERDKIVGILDWEHAHTAPLPLVMEAVFLWVWCNSVPYSLGPIRHTFNKLEQDMLDGFRARGRHDLASAFEKRRKYHHAFRNVAPISRLHLTWRRIVFLGEEQAGPGPTTYDEWLEKAMELYGQDEGFKKYMERIEAAAAAEPSGSEESSSRGSSSSSQASSSKESADTSNTEPQPASSAEEEESKPAPDAADEAAVGKPASTDPAADGDSAEVAVPVTGAVDASAKYSDAINDSTDSPTSSSGDTSSMPQSEPAALADDVALSTTTTAAPASEEVLQVDSSGVETSPTGESS